MKDLPLIMAHDQAEAWGKAVLPVHSGLATFYHDQVMDVRGTKVESFRILAQKMLGRTRKGIAQRRI